MSRKTNDDGIKVIAQNKKARFEYNVESVFEAGMILQGSEVKSLRDARASLSDSYAIIKDNECFLIGMHISPYPPAANLNHEPKRTRKLLLHAKEIAKLIGKLKQRGFTLIPTKIYFKNGRAKLELGLCSGKKKYDKRESIKQRDVKREISRAMSKKY